MTDDVETLDAPPGPLPVEEAPMDAVIIIKTTSPQGDVLTEVVTNGGVLATEVQTLIELGLKTWRGKIGLA